MKQTMRGRVLLEERLARETEVFVEAIHHRGSDGGVEARLVDRLLRDADPSGDHLVVSAFADPARRRGSSSPRTRSTYSITPGECAATVRGGGRRRAAIAIAV